MSRTSLVFVAAVSWILFAMLVGHTMQLKGDLNSCKLEDPYPELDSLRENNQVLQKALFYCLNRKITIWKEDTVLAWYMDDPTRIKAIDHYERIQHKTVMKRNE